LKLKQQLPATYNAFFQRFGRFTEIQRKTIPTILNGVDALICSGTASGKTEAACAPLIENNYKQNHPWTILYISPTRALVNDLYYRLYKPTSFLNLKVARRTGDHKDSLRRIPNILITTPESFDSLLCRNRREDKYGHDLAHVNAVILDEIHLLHGNARGTQIKWLIRRLQRLRTYAKKKKWISSNDIQLIALSATIPNASSVNKYYFNGNGTIIRDSGKRDIETVTADSESTSVLSALPAYVNSLETNEKILMFSNSRKRVDTLTYSLKRKIHQGYDIYAHHGSLSKNEREKAEFAIKQRKKVILCATSTLEIGVDIGDIDLIVLDAPPPDISALLQRIGRGNRRTNKTRVMACSETLQDYFIQNAMIDAARDGWLGKGFSGPNYAVFPQQIASYIFQSKLKKRRRDQIVEVLATNDSTKNIIQDILNKMIEDEVLFEDKNQVIKLGDFWWERAESMGAIHSNIEQLRGTNIIDIDTGESIAKGVIYEGGKSLGIGGKHLKVVKFEHMDLTVRHLLKDPRNGGKWRYVSSSCPVFSGPPNAIRRYLSIDENTWPIVRKNGHLYVFHLGGAIRKAMLTLIHHEYKDVISKKIKITEWSLILPPSIEEKPLWINEYNKNMLKILLSSDEKILRSIESIIHRPYANRNLPYRVRVEELWDWLDVENETRSIQQSEWSFLDSKEKINILEQFT